MRGMPVELMVEDGMDRSVGERADVDGARGGGFQPCDPECSGQTQDAKAGSEALLAATGNPLRCWRSGAHPIPEKAVLRPASSLRLAL